LEGPSTTSVNNNVNAEKRRKRFRTPLRIVLVLIAVSVLLFAGINYLGSPCDRTKSTYSNFVVEEQDSLKDVSAKLEDEGFIKSASGFELLTKLTLSGEFRPGTYFLSPSMSSFSIISTLNSGLTTSEGFTIPAGLTVDQIATSLDRDGLADKDAFLEAASSPALAEIDIIAEGSKGLKGTELIEGFLFPSEYVLSVDADESMMIIMMIDAFSNFYNEDYRARADELGITARQVLTIASIIEKETSVDKERAAISAVLHNRYNLEISTDEEVPDYPLCSPGKESIIAALYPDENDYTHYVLSSKLDGTHVFTDNDEEYEALLKEYEEAVEAKKAADESDEGEQPADDSESGDN
jgi:UPF0755 protein